MKQLTESEIVFFQDLLEYSPRLNNGYYYFQPRNLIYGDKRYKRSRVIMQLHIGMMLNIHEFVHHIDGDKTNDSIDNLELTTPEKHTSLHHAGKIKVGKFKPHNKLKKHTINKIKKLSKIILKSNGTPNYSKIGNKLNISGFTVSKYLLKKREV